MNESNIFYLINWLTFDNSTQMGSFRSQPDLQKHSESGKGVGLEFVSTHMCGTPLIYSGWRIYMEDAHIAISPLTDKKNSLFAVFDGHGGNFSLWTQAPKYPSSLKDISYRSWRLIKTTRKAIMTWPLNKLSSEWMSSFLVKPENSKSLPFRKKWGKSTTVQSTKKIHTLAARQTSFWSLLSSFTVQTQETQERWPASGVKQRSWARTTNHKIHSKSIESQGRAESWVSGEWTEA